MFKKNVNNDFYWMDLVDLMNPWSGDAGEIRYVMDEWWDFGVLVLFQAIQKQPWLVTGQDSKPSTIN